MFSLQFFFNLLFYANSGFCFTHFSLAVERLFRQSGSNRRGCSLVLSIPRSFFGIRWG